MHRSIQAARIKRASYRLAYRSTQSVTGIAMDAGYDAPGAFAHAFRQWFGQSPSSFGNLLIGSRGLWRLAPLDSAGSTHLQTTSTPDDVTVRVVQETPVAFMEHRGDPGTIGATIMGGKGAVAQRRPRRSRGRSPGGCRP